jgi:hypothetical protein
MSLFELYLKLGFRHIVDIHGYDHIVFVLALCAGYDLKLIKKVLILITAFTIGHSVTLVLSTLNILLIPARIIEFLIPVTIFITAVSNLLPIKKSKGKIVYLIALFFGLIHGLGFSYYLKELLGRESSIIKPLFAFNIGLEIGQIVILLIYFLTLLLATKLLNLKQNHWRSFISILAMGISVVLIIQKYPWY